MSHKSDLRPANKKNECESLIWVLINCVRFSALLLIATKTPRDETRVGKFLGLKYN